MLNREGLPPRTSRRRRVHASRLVRLVAVATLVVVAGIAIGAASRSHSVELSLATPQLGEVAVLVVLVLAGAIGLIIGSNPSPIWVLDPNRATSVKAGPRVPWGVRVVMTLLALMVVVFLVTSARTFSDDGTKPFNLPAVVPIEASNSAAGAGGGVGLVLACVAVAVTCGLVAAVLFREKRPEISVAVPRQEAAVAILDEGLGALLAERDPRRAVIAAYVAMERAMARKGWARRPHEAPTEHLARVLGVAPARAQDLDQLVDTYQFARFSKHAVTPAMRDAAVDSVRRLRTDLEEPA